MSRPTPIHSRAFAPLAFVLSAALAFASPVAGAVPGTPAGALEHEQRRATEERLALERRLGSGQPPLAVATSEPLYKPGEDALWSDRFGLPEFDARVTALTEFRGELIAAGFFFQAAGVPAHRIARWNGQRWAPLGEGLLKMEPLALAVVNDRLYAGGIDADGIAGLRSLIFAWDGTEWTNVSTNLADGIVRSFTIHEGTLVAGGQFVSEPTLEPHGVVRLVGSSWVPVGQTPQAYVAGVAAHGATLYAGGVFTSVDPGDLAPVVLAYTAGIWDTLARARGGGSNPYVAALEIADGDLVVGGYFTEINGVPASNLARLHSGTWSEIGGGAGYVAALRATPSGLLVSGYFSSVGGAPSYSIAHWTGTGWQTFGDGLYFGVEAMLEFNGRLIAGGSFTQTGDYQRTLISIASWDGTSWTRLRGDAPQGAGVLGFPGNPATVRALEVVDGSLYLGGSFFFEEDLPFWSPTRGVARWNGQGWVPVGPREFNGVVHAFAWYDNHLIAAGGFGLPSGSRGISNIARWSGEKWEPLGNGTDAPVYALAVHQGDLYAAGSFSLAGGLLCSGIARWNGATWYPVGPPLTPGGNPIFYALEVFGGRLVAGGQFSRIGDVFADNVASWDGAAWTPLGGGIDAVVRTLEVHQHALWAGGDVATQDDGSSAAVSHWDGAAWSHPPDQPNDSVHRLLSAGGELFAVGSFSQVGTGFMSGIARLDDAGWHGLGQGLTTWHTGLPFALAVHDGGLFAGGTFTLAGGKSSFHVARWDGLPIAASRPVALQPARPNPFERSTSVRFTVPSGASGSVAVLDLGGRVLRTLRSGPFGSGPVDVTWDGRADDGERVRPGVYFIRLRSTAGDKTARVAFVP